MRIILDNTFGQPMARRLSELVQAYHKGPPVEIIHKRDRFPQNTPDDVWVPKLAEEDWVVVSADLGRVGHPKLHQVCRDCKKSLFELTPSLCNAGTFEWIRIILHIWPEMQRSCSGPPQRYRVMPDGRGNFRCEPKPWSTGAVKHGRRRGH